MEKIKIERTSMEDLKARLTKKLFGIYEEDAKRQGICISCKQKIRFSWGDDDKSLGRIYSKAGQEEYKISQLCETCFDEITGGGR